MSSPPSFPGTYTWTLQADPTIQVLLPLPTSSLSRLDKLTLRSVNALVTNPPPLWTNKTIFLADLYAEKMSVQVNKMDEEERLSNLRWHNNPLNPPQGVSFKEWQKRCLEADERERRAREGSDTTIKPETYFDLEMDDDGTPKFKDGKVKPKKLKGSKPKAKSAEEVLNDAARLEELRAAGMAASKAKKRLSL
ncbi:hypothetical protein CONLIGDRAFT_700125 [Coniochaeta ligniaria NRRL 30616]|uniref:Uncharacterized protein n=1 Tax=Coniochaeta ligniaria NRRL 30616 TaxID=1408157 RepID=A0A1J7ISH8_9PEZI|nr:hypothetical protein CONLIGDRAFT_700125 [Coniochaeta ligniaria NRRL 30616]